MATWDIYRADELIATRVSTEELMKVLAGLLTKKDRITRSVTIRPGGSPVIGRVERVQDAFRCPACQLAVQVGDAYVTGPDTLHARTCSLFCQRRLTKER